MARKKHPSLSEDKVIHNLTRVSELSRERPLTHLTLRKNRLCPRFRLLFSLGPPLNRFLDQLLPNNLGRVKRGLEQVAPSFTSGINLLHQHIRDLMNESDTATLDRPELIIRALSLGVEGLTSQLTLHELQPKVNQAIGDFILEILRDIASSFDRPDSTAGVFRTLSQPGEEGKNIHNLSLICRSWKRLIQSGKKLETYHALNKKKQKLYEETLHHLESFLHKAYLLIWAKPIPLSKGTLFQTPVQADKNQAMLEGIDRKATPVALVKTLFGRWRYLPAIFINDRAIEVHGNGKAADWRTLCRLLLHEVDEHCVVHASPNALERQAQVLADYIQNAEQLEDNDQTNAGLVDYPAPEVMGKLFSSLQPLTVGVEPLLLNLLGNLAKPVPFEAESLGRSPWVVKIRYESRKVEVTQQRDFIIEDFMGDPIAYVTAEATAVRLAGAPWDYAGARILELCFRRSASQKQQAFLVESLPIAEEEKETILKSSYL